MLTNLAVKVHWSPGFKLCGIWEFELWPQNGQKIGFQQESSISKLHRYYTPTETKEGHFCCCLALLHKRVLTIPAAFCRGYSK